MTEWFEGKNSARWIGSSLCNETWGFHLNNVPLAKAFRDSGFENEGISRADLLNAILSTSSRREQLAMIAVARYSWDGDQGYGAPPSDDKLYSGEDL